MSSNDQKAQRWTITIQDLLLVVFAVSACLATAVRIPIAIPGSLFLVGAVLGAHYGRSQHGRTTLADFNLGGLLALALLTFGLLLFP